MASVAAQLLYLWALEAAGVVAELRWGAALVLPVAAGALVEALTEQVREYKVTDIQGCTKRWAPGCIVWL